MKDVKIEGVGTIYGGDYEKISIEGIGKLKGDATTNITTVEGMCKLKGMIITDQFICDGIVRAFRDIKAKRVEIEGVLKLRRASISADSIRCHGVMVCTDEVSADDIHIDGACSVARMYGDNIVIESRETSIIDSQIPTSLLSFSSLYFGRKLSTDKSLVDVIECTHLEASGLKAKTVRAQSVKLSNCVIDTLDCIGEMIIDDSCRIGKIISDNQPKREDKEMANTNLVKILDLYKNGKITADQAETMINSTRGGGTPDLLWEDDGKLRIVAYIGRKLLKKGEPGYNKITVEYVGDALNVESYGSLICGDVKGNATAGSSIQCGSIGGSANSGGSMTCGDIGGDVSCGGSVNCKIANGRISAGGGVNISK
jgi:hypothetical protein